MAVKFNEPLTLGSLFQQVRKHLREADIENPDLDARILIETAAGFNQTTLISCPEAEVPSEKAAELAALVDRRLAGEPVHRIKGSRRFYGLNLALSPDTLEPRPDTEILVDLMLPVVRKKADLSGECTILDLGTGSGAIALALLAGEKRATAVGTDISAGALATAIENASSNGLSGRFVAHRSNWFSNVTGRFDVIVANPPYIRRNDIAGLAREVRLHDPIVALDGGEDGLDAYRIIAGESGKYLNSAGRIAVEIGEGQMAAVIAIFEDCGLNCAASGRDLGDLDRVLVFAS